jgi:hypothetical protein
MRRWKTRKNAMIQGRQVQSTIGNGMSLLLEGFERGTGPIGSDLESRNYNPRVNGKVNEDNHDGPSSDHGHQDRPEVSAKPLNVAADWITRAATAYWVKQKKGALYGFVTTTYPCPASDRRAAAMELQPWLGLCSKRGIGIATVDRADSGADGIPSPQLLNNHPGCAALFAEPWMARSSILQIIGDSGTVEKVSLSPFSRKARD